MRILYLSCHEILEYDELKLFTELGHECYSLGAYTHPYGDEGRKRPGIPDMPYDPHFIELATRYDKELHPEMLEKMDIVIVMHVPEYIEKNWPVLKEHMIDKGKRVVWRSIGQSIPHVEERLATYRQQGLEIVRYSTAEGTIERNIGADAVIRFYKDPEEYKGWTGDTPRVINFTQSLKQRGEFCGYKPTMAALAGFDAKVYGPGNDDLGDLSGGLLTNDEQLEAFRKNRVYFYHGTYPASYTLSFIEAMMTGIPMVCVGPSIGNGPMFAGQRTYEIPDMITNGVNGFVSDDVEVLRDSIKQLIEQPELARKISAAGRELAIELFGKDKIKQEWENFLTGGSPSA